MITFKKLCESAEMPKRASDEAAGFDLYALEPEIIEPLNWKLIRTGISVDVGRGNVGFVCSRSGLALKQGLFVLNAPGIVDSDYRGDVGVILANYGPGTAYVKAGDRIAQLVVTQIVVASAEAEFLPDTGRGAKGFGSTGVNEMPFYVGAEDPC